MGFRPIVTVALALCAASCDHTAPFAVEDPDPVGPWSTTPPVRLTFNLGDDRQPAARDDLIVFSRLEAGRSDFDRCLAFLPIGVGTLSRISCAGAVQPDGVVDALTEPALSSDGRLAYVRDEGVPFQRGPSTRHLVVAPLASPGSPSAEYTVSFAWSDGRRVLALQQVSWLRGDVLRFLAGEESFPSVPTLPDTVFTPFGVAEFSVATGELEAIAATDSASAYVSSPDDGLWFVRAGAQDTLLFLGPGSVVPVSVGFFSGPVACLTVVDGHLVGALQTDPPVIEWLDIATGVPAGALPIPGRASRLASVPNSRRLVAELRINGSSDLWLLELP